MALEVSRWPGPPELEEHRRRATCQIAEHGLIGAPDGLAGDDATFSLCFFWWVEALARAERLDEARLAFEKMLTYANHVGLYSEETGPTGERLENFLYPSTT